MSERERLARRLIRLGYSYEEIYHWTTEYMRSVVLSSKGVAK